MEDCEEYIEKHGIQGLLKECIAKICQEQPANPYKWLSSYFSALDVKKVSLLPAPLARGSDSHMSLCFVWTSSLDSYCTYT